MNAAERAPWLLERRKYCGASDVAAIVGCDPHRGPLDVWSSKVLPPRVERETPAMQVGNALEPAILQLYTLRTGRPVEAGKHTIGPEPWIACTPDGRDPAPVQVKAVGRWMASDWKREGEPDPVPVYYLPQIQWEMLCTGDTHAHFIAGFDLTDFRIYRVERDDALILVLLDYCRDWWQRYVEPRDPSRWPPGEDAAIIRRALEVMYPRNVRPVREASEAEIMLATSYGDARAATKRAKSRQESAGNDVCAAIGHGEGWRGDWGVASWNANAKGKRTLYVKLKGDSDDE